MGNQNRLFIVIAFLLGSAYSCTKKDTAIATTAPSINASSVSNITTNEASITCRIPSNGNLPITSLGVCWATSAMPTVDSNKVHATLGTDSNFTVTLSGLKSGTMYYARSFAINNIGITYSGQTTFTTQGALPQATTDTSALMAADTVLLYGKVTPHDLQTTVSFEYGTTTSYGSVVPALQNPFSKGIDIKVSAKIAGLQQSTVYHYRVKAVNEKGTSYGEDKTVRLPDPNGTLGTVSDIDRNTYQTIVIGTQVWMMKNLQTTKFNDGTAIPKVTDVQWPKLATAAYCWYGNDESLNRNNGYGALYNWFAVATGKLAPQGWHVPSENEWKVLIAYLGGADVAGGKMKEAGPSHWIYSNTGATNTSGFTALPAGARFDSGFTFAGEDAYWWTTTSSASPEYAFYHFVDRNHASIDTFNIINYKVKGFSVRCVKD